MLPDIAPTPIIPPRPHWLRLPLNGPAKVKKRRGTELTQVRLAGTEARKAGVRYEGKAKEKLAKLLPGVEFGVWWEFYDGRIALQSRIVQTDGFWKNPDGDVVTIIEIKHHHTSDAWWQLRHYYAPVIRAYYGPAVNVNVLEMCRTFDPHVRLPEGIHLLKEEDVYGWCEAVQPPDRFGVFRWRP